MKMTIPSCCTDEITSELKWQKTTIVRFFYSVLFLLNGVYFSCAYAVIDPDFEKKLMQLAPYDEVSVIVTMKEMPHPEAFKVYQRNKRDGRLVKALRKHAQITQLSFNKYIKRRGLRKHRDLWHINGMMLKVRADQVRGLAAQPGVVSIRPDSVVPLAIPIFSAPSAVREWNLNAIHLPELWIAGHTGAGVVIATMDTGVDVLHPDLDGKWRGGSNSWYDPNGEHATPFDAVGHGTQVMGLLVGGNASGIRIGAAPDAKFIAAKIFDDSDSTTISAIHSAFQWLLDPDNNPNTQDQPDVVNASWGLPSSNNKCNVEFDTDIRMLQAAGAVVVFAGGNDGPAPATSVSPSSGAGFISTGAVNSDLLISNFSSRGPSPCSGGIFPSLVAPGEDIYTADLTVAKLNSYTTVSGSSFAAPHVAGIVALLAGAFPNLSVNDLENAVIQSTQDSGVTGPDNDYGAGLINGDRAFKILQNRPPGGSPVINSMPPIVAMQGVSYSYQVVATDPDGDSIFYKLDSYPSGMTISETGLISWVPSSSHVGQQLVVVRVTDTNGLYSTQPYVVVVANINDAPVANDDTYAMAQSTTLILPAPGVLLNDTDQNKDPLVIASYAPASTGLVTVNNDGSFIYTPPSPAFTGIVTFSYRTSDGALSSASATVTINVQPSAGGTLTIPGGFPVDNSIQPVPVITQPDQGGMGGAENNTENTFKRIELSVQQPVNDEALAPVITSNPITEATQSLLYTYQLAARDDARSELAYFLDAAPEGMTINSSGEISWTPNSSQAHTHTIVVRVTNAAKLFTKQTFSLLVKNTNDAPVAESDSYSMMQASVLNVAAPGVLRNDTDMDLNVLSAVNYSLPSAGSLQGNPNGSFVYTPPSPVFTGTISFTYKGSDGLLLSEAVKVVINVVANRAPLAADDFFNVAMHKANAVYTPITIKVLENDSDPDTELDPANKIDASTLKIVKQVDKGGSLKLSSAGVVTYTPALNFKGIETFHYNVKDTRHATSNTVSVQLNVK